MNDSDGNPLVIGKFYIFPGFLHRLKLIRMDPINQGMKIQPRGRTAVTALYLEHNRPRLFLDEYDPWSDKEEYDSMGEGNKTRKPRKRNKRNSKRRGSKRRGSKRIR